MPTERACTSSGTTIVRGSGSCALACTSGGPLTIPMPAPVPARAASSGFVISSSRTQISHVSVPIVSRTTVAIAVRACDALPVLSVSAPSEASRSISSARRLASRAFSFARARSCVATIAAAMKAISTIQSGRFEISKRPYGGWK